MKTNALQTQFKEVIQLIHQSRSKTLLTINKSLIELYWNIGTYISKRVASEEWGKSVVQKLAAFIEKTDPQLKGYSDKNLWRMKQFYEAYKDSPKLSPVVREVSWTNNLVILARTNTIEERIFYLNANKNEKYSKRELERQISSGLFERVALSNAKLPPVVRELYPDIMDSFKDSYIFDFLNLPDLHTEKDLQKGLIQQMKNFILELGKDFLFVGEEYKVQVGNSDFYIDLLFYHRGLQSLVVFELKADKFKPEHLGQLNFYLEALDRDVKKEKENPSIGILLCKDKDIEVVEYALSRNLSPALVAAYKTQLPDRRLLQQKLHELFKEKGSF
jgi:predicted nuclease of restriction endonuclease-like (RecB) superfamily